MINYQQIVFNPTFSNRLFNFRTFAFQTTKEKRFCPAKMTSQMLKKPIYIWSGESHSIFGFVHLDASIEWRVNSLGCWTKKKQSPSIVFHVFIETEKTAKKGKRIKDDRQVLLLVFSLVDIKPQYSQLPYKARHSIGHRETAHVYSPPVRLACDLFAFSSPKNTYGQRSHAFKSNNVYNISERALNHAHAQMQVGNFEKKTSIKNAGRIMGRMTDKPFAMSPSRKLFILIFQMVTGPISEPSITTTKARRLQKMLK